MNKRPPFLKISIAYGLLCLIIFDDFSRTNTFDDYVLGEENSFVSVIGELLPLGHMPESTVSLPLGMLRRILFKAKDLTITFELPRTVFYPCKYRFSTTRGNNYIIGSAVVIFINTYLINRSILLCVDKVSRFSLLDKNYNYHHLCL